MTRINLSFPPALLSNKHLVAEWRELLRMPRFALRYPQPPRKLPEDFRLGIGHMKSCLKMMNYLHVRQFRLGKEMEKRQFVPNWDVADKVWMDWTMNKPHWQTLYIYTENARDYNIVLHRLKERDPEHYNNIQYKQ